MESKGAEPPATLPTPGGGSGPADAQALPRAHPLPEPPLEQVSLGYMTVHFRRAHAGRRGAGRLRMPAGLKLLKPVALATRCGAILAPAPDLGGAGSAAQALPNPEPPWTSKSRPMEQPQTASTLRAATARPHPPGSGTGALVRPQLQGAFCGLPSPVCQLQTFARRYPGLRRSFHPRTGQMLGRREKPGAVPGRGFGSSVCESQAGGGESLQDWLSVSVAAEHRGHVPQRKASEEGGVTREGGENGCCNPDSVCPG